MIIAEPGGGRQRLGLRGEEEAARLLEGRGLVILERRFRTRLGEIDIVAEDGPVLVFVEVKARAGTGFGAPGEAVHAGKRRRMAQVARVYLATRGGSDRPCRFDVVEVRGSGEGPLRAHHIPDAFRLTPPGNSSAS